MRHVERLLRAEGGSGWARLPHPPPQTLFVSRVVTGELASNTPGRHPTPSPTRDPASPGGNSTRCESKIRGTVTRAGDGWLAYGRLEDPPGPSPITTVGRYATVEEAQVARYWASQ
jgi:hypothetical protein